MSRRTPAIVMTALFLAVAATDAVSAAEEQDESGTTTQAFASAEPAASIQTAIEPTVLSRSAVVERDGVRVRITLERNPMLAGRPMWVRTTVKNIGRDDLIWVHDTCATSVGVGGQMLDAEWRLGEPAGPFDPTGLKWRAVKWWEGGDSTIRLFFWPEESIGEAEIACADVALYDRIPPGGVLRGRARWDGMALTRLGLPPTGPARIAGRFGPYTRPSLKGGANRSIEVPLDVWIARGRDDDMLHPMEIVDAALADPLFDELMDGFEIGNRYSEIIWYDPELDLWEVGVFHDFRMRFTVALVDPRTGDVLGIIERPFDKRRDLRP